MVHTRLDLARTSSPVSSHFLDRTWQSVFQKSHALRGYTDSRKFGPITGKISPSQSYDTSLVSRMTGIPEQVLNKDIPLAAISVAYRFSWAAKRNTKRVEDMAYSLMGILQVNMPLLYGEGTKAFLRLQETVLSNSDDISAPSWGFGLPWNEISSLGGGAVLAMSPAAFMYHPPEYAQNFRYKPRLHTTITGHGMHIDLAMVCVDTKNAIWLAIVDDNPAFRGAWLNKSYGIAVILRMVELGDTPSNVSWVVHRCLSGRWTSGGIYISEAGRK